MLDKLKKLLKKPGSSSQGFTIIEVMIVLAVAALIILIVLLAVPALQRSSRNTQRKNDASAIASAIANYINNNGGALPQNSQADGSDQNSVDICGASCVGNYETAKLGYYNPSNVTFHAYSANLQAPDGETVYIVKGYDCNADGTGLGSTPNSRTAAILYKVESGTSNTATQCLEQ